MGWDLPLGCVFPSFPLSAEFCFVLCTALNVFSWSFLESSETGGKTEVPIAIYFCFSVGVDGISLIEVPTEGIRQQRKLLFFTVAKTLE